MSSKTINRIFVSALIALPVLPVLADYVGPSTYARWLLADAANQYDRGNLEKAHNALQQAYDLSPDISTDPNFWKQFERIEFDPENPSKSTKLWSDMVRIIDNEEERAVAAMMISGLLSNRKQFDVAASLLQEFLPSAKDRSPIQNNQVAYMRALAGEELDAALSEINQALKGEDHESFLDTKAWVLHRMGRNEEALPVVDRSLSILLGKWRANSLLEPLVSAMEKIEEGLAPKPKVEASEIEESLEHPTEKWTEANGAPRDRSKDRGWAHHQLMEEFPVIARTLPDRLDVLVTLRYHRMKILEGLGGHDDEVAKELRWLDAFTTKELDELY